MMLIVPSFSRKENRGKLKAFYFSRRNETPLIYKKEKGTNALQYTHSMQHIVP